MSLVARRYAEALIGTSLQKDAVDGYRSELCAIMEICSENPDLLCFLTDPQVDINTRKETVRNIFGGRIDEELLSLLLLLLDRNRMDQLSGIVEEYNRLADQKLEILNMKIISASPIETAQLEKIKEKYRKIHKAASVKAETVVDKSVIGGVKVVIGDKMIDGTVKGALEGLMEWILES